MLGYLTAPSRGSSLYALSAAGATHRLGTQTFRSYVRKCIIIQLHLHTFGVVLHHVDSICVNQSTEILLELLVLHKATFICK